MLNQTIDWKYEGTLKVGSLQEIPITGPVSILDNRVYTSPSESGVTAALLSDKDSSTYRHMGELSDTLAVDEDDISTPIGDMAGFPGLFTHTSGFGHPYVGNNDYRWKIPYPPVLGSTGWMSGTRIPEDFSLVYRFMQSTNTENYQQYLGSTTPVNNPNFRFEYEEQSPLSIYLKVTEWSDPEPVWLPAPRYRVWDYTNSTIVETFYVRILVFGIASNLLYREGLPPMLGDADSEAVISTDGDISWMIPFDAGYPGAYDYAMRANMTKAVGAAGSGLTDMIVSILELKPNVTMIKSLPSRVRTLKRTLSKAWSDGRIPFGHLFLGNKHGLRPKGLKSKDIPKLAWKDRLVARRTALRQASKDSANAWLEGKYGWQQLYFDFTRLVKSLKTAFGRLQRSYSRGSGRKYEYLLWDEFDSDQMLTFGYGTYSFWIEGYVRNNAGVCIKPDWLDSLGERIFHNFGRANVIASIYEYYPLSFMLDAFVDFGSFITSLTTNPNLWSHAWGTLQTEREINTIYMSYTLAQPDINSLLDWYGCGILPPTYDDPEVTYTVSNLAIPFGFYIRMGISDPASYVTVPEGAILRHGPSWQQAVDMVTLARQRI